MKEIDMPTLYTIMKKWIHSCISVIIFTKNGLGWKLMDCDYCALSHEVIL